MHCGPRGSALTLSRPKAHQIVEYVAARQTWADNISKEILQYRVVNANCLNVYSNQEQHTQAFGWVVERNAGIVLHGTVRSDGFDSSSSRYEVIRANWVCCWENGLIVLKHSHHACDFTCMACTAKQCWVLPGSEPFFLLNAIRKIRLCVHWMIFSNIPIKYRHEWAEGDYGCYTSILFLKLCHTWKTSWTALVTQVWALTHTYLSVLMMWMSL